MYDAAEHQHKKARQKYIVNVINLKLKKGQTLKHKKFTTKVPKTNAKNNEL